MVIQSIPIKLTRNLLEDFRYFLNQKEAKLGDQLLLAIIPIPGTPGSVHLHGSGHMRLTQAIQLTSNRIKELKESDVGYDEWKLSVQAVNSALWEYVEILEGGVKEFIQQVNQTDLQDWTLDFFEIVGGFKEVLLQRIEEFIWIFKRLENLYLSYRAICHHHKSFWSRFGKIFSPYSRILDPNILKHLFSLDELLSRQFKILDASFLAYRAFLDKVSDKEQMLINEKVFNELSPHEQRLFLRIFRLTELWQEPTKFLEMKNVKIFEAIKNISRAGVLNGVFKHYYHLFHQKLFELSSKWIKTRDESLKESVTQIKKELSTYNRIISVLREIYLQSNPNPYSRRRFSITKWIVGPESRKTRNLLEQIYEDERLLRWYTHLEASIQKEDTSTHPISKAILFNEIDEVLHDMGQPLTSRGALQHKTTHLMDLLDKTDELGGSLGDIHNDMTQILFRALKADSKYQLLFDFDEFKEIYAIHKGFLKPLHDPSHEKRIKLFNQVIQHVERWLKEHSIFEHQTELEVDEAALLEELQMLLASLQKESLPKDRTVQDYFQMLLEYRFIIDKFFHLLRTKGSEGVRIRTLFLFIDHYFEAIEKELNRWDRQQ